MNTVSRRTFVKRAGLGAVLLAGGCTMRRPVARQASTSTRPHTYGYHPYENGIPAKGHSMTYFVVGPGGAVMIDPGRGTAHDELIAFIHGIGLAPGDIRLALLTHCHADHTGGARLIQSEGIPVAASPFTAQAVKEAALDMGFQKPRPELSCEVDRLLSDGEVVEICGMRIRTVATPGHTAGCLSFLVETDEGLTAFTGDLIRQSGHSGWTGSPSFSRDDSNRSVKKLLALRPDKGYWGHGEVAGSAEAWLRRSLELYEKGRWIMD